MIYAELGRIPVDIQIKTRMISFWISLINGNRAKYAKNYTMACIMKKKKKKNGSTYKWIDYIKHILISTGKPNLFHQAFINNPHATKGKNGKTLQDLFIQDWAANKNQK